MPASSLALVSGKPVEAPSALEYGHETGSAKLGSPCNRDLSALFLFRLQCAPSNCVFALVCIFKYTRKINTSSQWVCIACAEYEYTWTNFRVASRSRFRQHRDGRHPQHLPPPAAAGLTLHHHRSVQRLAIAAQPARSDRKPCAQSDAHRGYR